MKSPLVSVIILNWNGKKWLEKCLPSFSKVKYPNIEMIVVNNGSSDNSDSYIKKNFPNIKIVKIIKNVGYAKASNIGADNASGKYLLFINNDTSVTPDFLSPLVKDLETDKTIGIVQPQIRSMINTELLDSVGAFLTFTGFLYYFGLLKPYSNKIYQKPMFVYSIKGACFIISKEDYVKLGGFDVSFFSYVEETDLCHRMWLFGKKVLYDPKSYMYHWGGGDTQMVTKTEATIYRSFRNRLYSYFKNFSLIELMKILPAHFVMCELYVLLFFVRLQLNKAIAVQLATFGWIFNLPSILKKRSYIQSKIRKVSDGEIGKYIKKEPRISYYWQILIDIKNYRD